jgi:hypothetical protein
MKECQIQQKLIKFVQDQQYKQDVVLVKMKREYNAKLTEMYFSCFFFSYFLFLLKFNDNSCKSVIS